MRKGALLLLIIASTITYPRTCRAEESDNPIGKAVVWETMNPQPKSGNTRGMLQTEETPNQRRKRLGQPVVESYPPQDYGSAQETPNQMRQRIAEAAEIANRR